MGGNRSGTQTFPFLLIPTKIGLPMMHPSYNSWKAACQTMQNQKRRLRCYLQWYPFSVLDTYDWLLLSSEDFYSTYIKDGSFITCASMNFITNGFIQKQGASFRDSTLVSPVMFLYLVAFGIEYQKSFADLRGDMICEYAGDLANNQAQYKHSYRRYCDQKRIAKSQYSHYLKTDISNFYNSVNVDTLMSKMQRQSTGSFSATDCLFIRALLLYCGSGKFPTIQNHPTLSFLTTKVFLSDIDAELIKSINGNTDVASFKMIRYVDDMLIFFNASHGVSPFKIKELILNKYADILRRNGLAINLNKVEFNQTSKLSLAEASESYVDFSGCYAEEVIDNPSERISQLFNEITRKSSGRDYREKDFYEAVELAFSQNDKHIDPITAFRNTLYRNVVLNSQDVRDSIYRTLSSGKVTLTYSTNELVKCILDTHDEHLIKHLLSVLFLSYRGGYWSSIDTLIAINYLTNRGMQHRDLLSLLNKAEPGLSVFIDKYCISNRFVRNPVTKVEAKVLYIIADDYASKIQFASQLFHERTQNYFEQVSYFRAYFDRFSTFFKRKIMKDKQKGFLYKERDLFQLYSQIPESKIIIRNAEKLRQNNPLVHASSKLICDTYQTEIITVKRTLERLIAEIIEDVELPSDT